MAVTCKICSSSLHLSSTWSSGEMLALNLGLAMQPVLVCTFPPFHSSALLSSPGKAISSRALISYHSWDGKHIKNTSAEHPSQRHILCAWIQTGPVQEHRSAQFYTALTSSLLLLLLVCEIHLQVFVMNTSWWALLSVLMLRWVPPFCPARLAALQRGPHAFCQTKLQRHAWSIILHPSPWAQTNMLIHADTTAGRSACFLPLTSLPTCVPLLTEWNTNDTRKNQMCPKSPVTEATHLFSAVCS